jgi:uncharacterized protein (TIGR03000 family)
MPGAKTGDKNADTTGGKNGDKNGDKNGGKNGDKNGDKDDGATSTRATLVVSLPTDARLTIQGSRTASTSSRRVFVSPPLPRGKTFVYTLEAQFNQAGRPVTVKRDVEVRAGTRSQVLLTAPQTRLVRGR